MDKATALDIIKKSIDDFEIESLTEEMIGSYNEAASLLGLNRIILIEVLKKFGFNTLQDFRESKKVYQKSKVLGTLSGMALGNYMAFGFIEFLDTSKTKPFTFEYNIDDITNKGIIKKRYYMEWKNRHGGDCSGLFYKMYHGKSFNEILIKKVS